MRRWLHRAFGLHEATGHIRPGMCWCTARINKVRSAPPLSRPVARERRWF